MLATGGGAFIDPATRELIQQRGVSVWLRAELDVLEKRTKGRAGRPLLETRDSRATLAVLMAARYPIYAEANLVVDTRDEPPEVTTARVLDALSHVSVRGRDEGGGRGVRARAHDGVGGCDAGPRRSRTTLV